MDMKQFEIQENEKPLDIIKENCGFASIFKTMGSLVILYPAVNLKQLMKTVVQLITICMNIRGPLF